MLHKLQKEGTGRWRQKSGWMLVTKNLCRLLAVPLSQVFWNTVLSCKMNNSVLVSCGSKNALGHAGWVRRKLVSSAAAGVLLRSCRIWQWGGSCSSVPPGPTSGEAEQEFPAGTHTQSTRIHHTHSSVSYHSVNCQPHR